jgi:hypothetical protein
MSKKASIEERFFEKVTKTDSCWLWTGAISSTGYGSFRIGQKIVRTHRYSYLMHIGEIPQSFEVCHTCDVRACVNPEHLWVGTKSDNMKDMFAKGRNGLSSRPRTHCKRGHHLETYAMNKFLKKYNKVKRYCGECKRMRDAEYRNKKRNL